MTTPAFLDAYPDESRDDPTEGSDQYAVHQGLLEDLFPTLPDEDPVPTVDSTEADVEALMPTYKTATYRTSDTFVIWGACTLEGSLRGYPRFMSREQARRWVAQTYGARNVYERLDMSHRWGYRVRKPTAPGGQYTPPQPKEPT